jgi:hypothetical protein
LGDVDSLKNQIGASSSAGGPVPAFSAWVEAGYTGRNQPLSFRRLGTMSVVR